MNKIILRFISIMLFSFVLQADETLLSEASEPEYTLIWEILIGVFLYTNMHFILYTILLIHL